MRAPHGFHCEVFLKIGGSILDNDAATAQLVPHITALAGSHRIVIMPGGGRAVKRIKSHQRHHGTDFHSCWIRAVLCLDVNAGILGSCSKSFHIVSSLEQIAACFAAGKVAVFAPAGAIFNSLQLTPDFEATTDSMGLYFASTLGASRYIIVSDVNGIYAHQPDSETSLLPIPQLDIEALERLPSSKLDPAFPQYWRRYPLPTSVVNGKHPARVSAAICGQPTISTEIRASL